MLGACVPLLGMGCGFHREASELGISWVLHCWPCHGGILLASLGALFLAEKMSADHVAEIMKFVSHAARCGRRVGSRTCRQNILEGSNSYINN